MFLRRISDIFRKNTKKILSYIFLSAMFFMFSWGINISNISNYNQNNNSKLETLNLEISFDSYKVYAADAWASDLSTWKWKESYWWTWTSKDAQKWLNIWNWIVAWISAVLWVLTYMVTMLLDPGFTSWTMFWINDKLHQIWILVSNVVYFIFAFLLIWIAFMNIIWKWNKWELKQAMPKFIVWVLIVPFSWFFVNLVVSLANILTFSALSLPADTFPSYETVLTKINIPKSCELNLKTWAKEWLHCEKWDKNLWDVTSWSAYWLLSTYTYWLLKIDTLPKVQWHNVASWAIKSVEDLIIYLLFSWIFILVYAILIITLAIVLLVRAVWLWLYLALSPLFWLAYFFWKDWGGDFMKKFNVSEFIWLAMVPFYSVLALSFWFLFLSITMQWLSTDAHKADKSSNYEITEKWMTITLPTKDWTVKTELKVDDSWAFANLLWDTKSAFNVAKEIWYTNWLWFIWAIFMNIFWVVVFRIAVMAALQASTITKAIVAPIKQFGDSVWSLVSKAPTYAPVFGGKSMTELWQAASTFQWTVSWYYSNKWSKLWTSFAEKTWFHQSETRKVIEEFNRYTDNGDRQANLTIWKHWLEQLYKAKSQTEFNDLVDKMIEKGVLIKGAEKKITWSKKTSLDWKNFGNLVFDNVEDKFKNNTDEKLKEIDDYQRLYTDISTRPNVDNKDTSNTSWTKNQKLKVEYSSKDNRIPIRFELWDKTIELENSGKKISYSSLDEFARAIDWKTKKEIETLFSNTKLDQYITLEEAVNQVKSKWGGNIIELKKEKDWDKEKDIFHVDFSKKKVNRN